MYFHLPFAASFAVEVKPGWKFEVKDYGDWSGKSPKTELGRLACLFMSTPANASS